MAVHNKQELLEHYGHEVEVAYYGPWYGPVSVTIECLTCNEVLVDFEDYDEEEE